MDSLETERGRDRNTIQRLQQDLDKVRIVSNKCPVWGLPVCVKYDVISESDRPVPPCCLIVVTVITLFVTYTCTTEQGCNLRWRRRLKVDQYSSHVYCTTLFTSLFNCTTFNVVFFLPNDQMRKQLFCDYLTKVKPTSQDNWGRGFLVSHCILVLHHIYHTPQHFNLNETKKKRYFQTNKTLYHCN